METKIINNPLSDLKIKHYKLVCFDNNDDENVAINEIHAQISTANLPIQVEFPTEWEEFEKELAKLRFQSGLYTVQYRSEHQFEESESFNIENLREIGDITEIMYIQQKFHYDLDKKYFETPEKFNFDAYMQDMIEHQKLFCIYEKDKLAAFAALEADDGLYISELIVDEQFRGKGLGKALMIKIINYAKTHENSKLWTTLSTKNSNALEFYIRSGFIQTKQRWYKT